MEAITLAGEVDAWLDEVETDVKSFLTEQKFENRQLQETRRMKQRVNTPEPSP